MSIVVLVPRPPAWDVLAQALHERCPVRALYHGTERVLCPHVLGWKAGRAKALCYQVGGTTGHGALPADPEQRWRSLFVDDLEAVESCQATAGGQPPTTPSSAIASTKSSSTSVPDRPEPSMAKSCYRPRLRPSMGSAGVGTRSGELI